MTPARKPKPEAGKLQFRIGYGWDSHEFQRGIPLKIGGVTLPHPKGLGGHSDGDVLLHALTDALLGAVAAPDIGFPFLSLESQMEGSRFGGFFDGSAGAYTQRGLHSSQCRFDADPGRAKNWATRRSHSCPLGRIAQRVNGCRRRESQNSRKEWEQRMPRSPM